MEWALRGLRWCLSGLGRKSLISAVEDTLGFWQRESKLLEAEEARLLRSARREEKEFSEVALGRRWIDPALGLLSSSFSIGSWRDRMCFLAVSDRFVLSRLLWTGAISIISGVGSKVTDACEPWSESCLKGLVSSTDSACRWSLSIPGWRYPLSLDTLCTKLPFVTWRWFFSALRLDDAFNKGLDALALSPRFGTESLLDILRACDDDMGGAHFGDL